MRYSGLEHSVVHKHFNIDGMELSARDAERLYRSMLRIRLVEEAIAEEYPKQQMRCPVHLCIGQEAVAAGVSDVLEPQDWVMSGHRSHGHYLARGGSLEAMLAELYGKLTGCGAGKGGSMHLIDLAVGFLGAVPIVASTVPIGVGAAFGAMMRGEPRVVIVYLGDGAMEEGVAHESLSFAALKRLPVVFVCENNFFSVYTHISARQPEARSLSQVARGHGVQAYAGDGNNVLEVRRLASDAVSAARRGEGPVFLELTTYRWREHCGPHFDDQLGYRHEGELARWQEKCPLQRFARAAQQAGALNADVIATTREAVLRELAEALRFAQESPFPTQVNLLEHIFAD